MIQLEERPVFLNAVYFAHLDELDNELIANEILDRRTNNTLKERDAGREISNEGGFQSNNMMADLPLYEGLPMVKDLTDSMVQEVYNRWGIGGEAKATGMWSNVNNDGHFNHTHAHPGSKMSAVYYVEVPENSGNICFKRPDVQEYCFVPETDTDFTSRLFCIKPVPGMGIVFPSYFDHYVEQNRSGERRISIAFNYN